MTFLKECFGKIIKQEDIELLIDILDVRIAAPESMAVSSSLVSRVLIGKSTAQHMRKLEVFGKYPFDKKEDIVKVCDLLIGTCENNYSDGFIKGYTNQKFDIQKLKIWKKYFESIKHKYEGKDISTNYYDLKSYKIFIEKNMDDLYYGKYSDKYTDFYIKEIGKYLKYESEE